MATGSAESADNIRSRTRKVPFKKLADTAMADQDPVVSSTSVTIGDLTLCLSLVFGGCCTNVWTLEQLLNVSRDIGTTITFSQVVFVTLQTLPSFLTWTDVWIPRLKPREVPLRKWAAQVLVLFGGTLLNNWAFAYSVPLTLQIVFRSGGLAVSMLFGYLFMGKRYSLAQTAAVGVVSAGVVIATLSKPSSSSVSPVDPWEYTLGVSMLSASLVLTGILGVMQEKTYKRHGPCWKEGVFYTHLLALPIFLPLMSEIRSGLGTLAVTAPSPVLLSVPTAFISLAINLVSQLTCVSGVNQLTSRTSSLSTQIVLTARKALSLLLSVMLFGSPWNAQLGVGAGMVFFGSVLYTLVSVSGKLSPPPPPPPSEKTNGDKLKEKN